VKLDPNIFLGGFRSPQGHFLQLKADKNQGENGKFLSQAIIYK